MRVIRIEFHGYQRLVNTGCNTDGKMIAFVGPNEAGKTTVLNALNWFSNGDELPARSINRRSPPDDDTRVVRARYWLEAHDLEALEGLQTEGLPKTFSMSKYPSGEIRTGIQPDVGRATGPFERARTLLAQVEKDYEDDLEYDRTNPNEDPDHEETLGIWIQTVSNALGDPEATWDEAWDDHYDQFVDYLREVPDPTEGGQAASDGEPMPRNSAAADALDAVRAILKAPHPNTEARRLLKARAPEFILFTQADRDLKSTYDLSDEELRSDPPSALANLAWVAGLDLDELFEAIEADDLRHLRTTERQANERLRQKFGPRWSQKPLDVYLNVSGSEIEVLIQEHAEDGADTPIEERSDGLKTFVALVSFLARHDFEIPPVLLIDEAETHLHYDAQADLLEVLTNDVEATQVFYTTHSPGCLPRDLGTGIRLVSPDKKRSDASITRNDFWTSEGPGFTPLLFAMGAGAAAFSAFRRAVLTEGAGDMILLPTLLRTATGTRDLDFQVAPGLANYHGSGLTLEEAAARVVYLVDGDPGGDDNKRRLIDMGINKERIKRLDDNKASEDYVHLDDYLEVVNGLLAAGGSDMVITLDDLDMSKPISTAVGLWCGTNKVKAPGKTVVATYLVNKEGGFRLADGAEEALRTLYGELTGALAAMPR